MKFRLLFVPVLLLSAIPTMVLAAACPPADYSRQDLLDIKAQEFVISDDRKRNALAVGLLACVADPDPMIRDGVVYESYATWLRAEALDADTVDTLLSGLMVQLSSSEDQNGFQQPFAALLLSEVARTDRVKANFSTQKRAALVAATGAYLMQVDDYRGYSETEGWRHGVAHASDLVLQLVLNDNISAEQVSQLMAAVAGQVAPAGAVFYIYGEPGRLARAAYYAHRRNVLGEDDWQAWLTAISNPAPLESWGQAFSSQAGLAKRHNTLAFLTALLFYAEAAEDENGARLSKQVMGAIMRLM